MWRRALEVRLKKEKCMLRSSVLLFALLLAPMPVLRCQSTVSPEGHWKGTLQMPAAEIAFEIDITRDSPGVMSGSLSVPSENLHGLPMRKIVLSERNAVDFSVRDDQPFSGTLSADGASITGNMYITGLPVPFRLARTGAARIEPPARLTPVSGQLEGVWEAALGSKKLRLVLTIANQPPAGARATLVNLDEGGLEIPVSRIVDSNEEVVIEFDAVGGSFSGRLDRAGTALEGTYKQGSVAVPAVFRKSLRAAAGK
jgi:hypothetical protein